MRKSIIVFIVLLSIMLASCAITKPVLATANPIGTKIGRSLQTSILFFPPLDKEAGIYIAAKNAGITKISTVDYKISCYIFWTDFETIVTGE